jgi:acyl carrier protein
MAIIDDEQSISDSDNIFEKGFVDSMFAMQLISFLENEFNMQITDEDLDIKNFSSIKNITVFLEKKGS